jgi:uncharacterized metal-binding protein YceD (DUF177 family)
LPPDFSRGQEKMKSRNNNDFDIPFKGLALGTRQYSFKIGNKFFNTIEYSEIKKGDVTADVELIKESTMLIFNFSLKGSVELNCDRCLENYHQPIKGNFKLIVKFGEQPEELSDEIITISNDDTDFDLTHYLYEYIVLLLPLKHVHPDDENGNPACSVDMLNQIAEYSEKKSDPRWAALKNIKLD